jgi:hypothetical protein
MATALCLVALAWPVAGAEYLGSDLVGNVSPEPRLAGGLVDRYPLSAYALDYHVDVGLTNIGGVPPMIAQWAAAQLWSVTSFLVKTVIDLLTWAFSLDLLGGTASRLGDGALAPVADAIASLYENVIGEAWMVAGIVIAGMWGIWKALVQRRYTETAGALAVSVLFVVVALFFVYQPERTVGEASRWTNTLSLAFLSGANRGSLDDPEQAKRQVADHLFETLVYRPWAVLQFGGLRHCVDTGRTDDDGYPRPVGPHDPERDVCRDHLKPGRDGHGGYAPRFLRQRPESEKRTAEYEALRDGEAPMEEQFAGYRVDKSDSPAVDIQQSGGAFQRLTFSAIVFLGALGAVALLGFLSLAVILAQVVGLVLLGFAPVALVIGIFPGKGHDFFRGWMAKLATAIFIKALYSLVIAIVVAVSAALAASTGSLGFLFAFGLQTIFFWAIFLYRKEITARLVAATTGDAHKEHLPPMSAVQRGAHVAVRPFSALVGVTRGGGHVGGARQESALPGGSDTLGSEGADRTDGAPGSQKTAETATGRSGGERAMADPNPTRPLTSGDPLFNDSAPRRTPSGKTMPSEAPQAEQAAGAIGGEARASTVPPVDRPVGAADHRHPVARGSEESASARTAEATPRATHEDVMRRARELRERERVGPVGEEERDG